MYCKVCGAEIAEKSLYCQFCGASQVKDAAAPNPAGFSGPEPSRPLSGNAAAQVQAQPIGGQAAAVAQTVSRTPIASQAATAYKAAQTAPVSAPTQASAGMFANEPQPEHPPEHYKREAEKALPSKPARKDPFDVGDIQLTLEPYKEDLEEYERKQEERRAEEARRKEQEERDAATLKIAEQAAQRAAEVALAAQKAADQAAREAAEKAAKDAQKAAKHKEQTAQQSAFTPDYNSWHSTSGKPVSASRTPAGNTYTSRRDGTTKTVTSNESSYSYNYNYNANVSGQQQPQPQPQPQQAPVIVNLNTTHDDSGRNYRNGYADGYHSARRERHDTHVYKSKWLAMLLCMFGGVLGLHRFYTGKIFSGLIYLFTGGFFGFGWIVDLVLIIIGGYRDADGHFLQ